HEGHQQGDVFDRIIRVYDRWLGWVLRHQPLMLGATLATLALTALLYLAVPKGFFPIQDAGLIQGITEAPQSVSFSAMSERQQALAEAILDAPEVRSVSSFIGVDGTNATLNSGRMLIELAPHAERGEHALGVIERLRERVAGVP